MHAPIAPVNVIEKYFRYWKRTMHPLVQVQGQSSGIVKDRFRIKNSKEGASKYWDNLRWLGGLECNKSSGGECVANWPADKQRW